MRGGARAAAVATPSSRGTSLVAATLERRRNAKLTQVHEREARPAALTAEAGARSSLIAPYSSASPTMLVESCAPGPP
jgi:hypothetical protein